MLEISDDFTPITRQITNGRARINEITEDSSSKEKERGEESRISGEFTENKKVVQLVSKCPISELPHTRKCYL